MLLQWIMSLDKRGLPSRAALVRDMANTLLRERLGDKFTPIRGY